MLIQVELLYMNWRMHYRNNPSKLGMEMMTDFSSSLYCDTVEYRC